MKKIGCLIALLIVGLSTLKAQDKDPILFSVDDTPVKVSEFDYIYSKTNGEQANYSKASLEEYLDLYVKFKLKVKRAKELKLDTISSLKNELAGYRRQLADSYLINKEVTEALTKELYEHKQQDVDISHIFFQLPKNAKPSDTLAIYNKAMGVKKQLATGVSFATLAKSNSDDRSALKNGGRIGFITAIFPPGFYNFEKAAYTLAINQVSDPIRTTNGYHILRVNARRPARGKVETAQILLRTKDKVKTEVKAAIDKLYEQLKNGADFSELAKKNSEDSRTAPRGGYIGMVGINQYEEVYEDAIFSLEKDSDFSAPFESALGYHIVKRISKKELGSYDVEKAGLEALIKKDQRFELSRAALISSIKEAAKFQEFPLVLKRFIQTQNDTVFTFRWKPPSKGGDQVLFTLGDEKVSLTTFCDYLSKSTRKRLRFSGSATVSEGLNSLYDEFVEDQCMRYEENQLEEKYPDFKALMREYREGILLFEVTKQNVWDKAAKDTVGLTAFHKTIANKHKWNTRARVTVYTIPQRAESMIQTITAYAKNHSPEEVKNEFKLDGFESVEDFIEKDKSTEALNIRAWEKGFVSAPMANKEKEIFTFMKVEEILAARAKTLNEARGYIIADYQDHLEKQWVDSLRSKYNVKINRKVFESLIKEQ